MTAGSELQATLRHYLGLKGDGEDRIGSGSAVPNPACTWSLGPWGLTADCTASGAGLTLTGTLEQAPDFFTFSTWVCLDPAAWPGPHDESGTIIGPIFVDGRSRVVIIELAATQPPLPIATFTGTIPLTVGEWHHVLVAFRGYPDPILSLYVDGSLDSAWEVPGGRAQADPWRGGIGATDGLRLLGGSVAEVMYFGMAAEQEHVDLLCTDITCPSPASAVEMAAARGADPDALGDPDGKPPAGLFGLVVGFVVVTVLALVVEYWFATIREQGTVAPPVTPEELAKRITAQVGSPASRSKRVARSDIGVDSSTRIHLDLGGEGYFVYQGVTAGWTDAINVNETKENSQTHQPIPSLVLIEAWASNPPLPFADEFADYLTLQNAPLVDFYVPELARIVRRGGSIGLWIDRSIFQSQIDTLARSLSTMPNYSPDDEFDAKGGYPKILLTRPA
jgi:Concanavalin A-like lectin/glucanases superfamily